MPELNSARPAPSPPAPASCNLTSTPCGLAPPANVGIKRAEPDHTGVQRHHRPERRCSTALTLPPQLTIAGLARGGSFLQTPQWRPLRRRRRRWRSSTRGRLWGSRRTTPPATSRPSTSPEGTHAHSSCPLSPGFCHLQLQLHESLSSSSDFSPCAGLSRGAVSSAWTRFAV
jgi:hypothetical protein